MKDTCGALQATVNHRQQECHASGVGHVRDTRHTVQDMGKDICDNRVNSVRGKTWLCEGLVVKSRAIVSRLNLALNVTLVMHRYVQTILNSLRNYIEKPKWLVYNNSLEIYIYFSRLFALSINIRNFSLLWDGGEWTMCEETWAWGCQWDMREKKPGYKRNKWDGKWGHGRA